MATLKEHQAAMVDLLANGSGIPASASRLAHAMHDVLQHMTTEQLVQFADWRCQDATTPGLNDKAISKPQKALKTDSPAKWPTPAEQRVKELENTIKQLKSQRAKDKAVIEELRGFLHEAQDVRKSLQEQALDVGVSYAELGMRYAELVKILAFYGVDDLDKARAEYLKYNGSTEQAGCRKPDTQVCEHEWRIVPYRFSNETYEKCNKCGWVQQ